MRDLAAMDFQSFSEDQVRLVIMQYPMIKHFYLDSKLQLIQADIEKFSMSSWFKFSSYHHWNILIGAKPGMFSGKKETTTLFSCMKNQPGQISCKEKSPEQLSKHIKYQLQARHVRFPGQCSTWRRITNFSKTRTFDWHWIWQITELSL